jgi:hypothetical protein
MIVITRFDPDSWSGDANELRGLEEHLLADADVCDRTFSSKHEAFAAGLHVGETATFRLGGGRRHESVANAISASEAERQITEADSEHPGRCSRFRDPNDVG